MSDLQRQRFSRIRKLLNKLKIQKEKIIYRRVLNKITIKVNKKRKLKKQGIFRQNQSSRIFQNYKLKTQNKKI